MKKFQASVCECCGQTKDYAIALDRGSALLVLALANASHRLGKQAVHPMKEMLAALGTGKDAMHDLIIAGEMTPRMIGNLSRPRYHGLIAFADKGSGEYLITPKGAAFLKGSPVDRIAIIDKGKGKNAGYWEAGGTTTIQDLLPTKEKMWLWNITEREMVGAGTMHMAV